MRTIFLEKIYIRDFYFEWVLKTVGLDSFYQVCACKLKDDGNLYLLKQARYSIDDRAGSIEALHGFISEFAGE